MTYNKQLVKEFPRTRYLLELAKEIHFPAAAGTIRRSARNLGYTRQAITFLHLFPAGEIFRSRTDFMTRCSEVAMLIKQERIAPKEVLRSPQG
jgi:hypothetical protein